MGYEPAVSPQLAVRRGREAIEFYKAAFGARELYRVGGTDEDEEVVAQLAVGGGVLLGRRRGAASKNFSPESLGGSTVKLLLIDDDPQAVVERAIGLGATEVYPVERSARLAAGPHRRPVRPSLGDRQAAGGLAPASRT